MNFAKLQGAGNDFVLVETGDANHDWSRLAAAICNRRFGVGADGLLLLLPSEVADFRLRIFNPDGSEAEACGNGLRCAVKYGLDKGLLAGNETGEISIETIAGVRAAKVVSKSGKLREIKVSLGVPEFEAKEIPVEIKEGNGELVDIKSMLSYTVSVDNRPLSLNFVSMGNPHAVYFYERPVAGFPLAKFGPKLEHHRIFPKRTNFEVARVINKREIEVRVWERGAGETPACGSGAAAVAVAAQLHGFVESKVDVILPGGILNVEWDRVGEVLLSGPAELVFTGKWLGEV